MRLELVEAHGYKLRRNQKLINLKYSKTPRRVLFNVEEFKPSMSELFNMLVKERQAGGGGMED